MRNRLLGFLSIALLACILCLPLNRGMAQEPAQDKVRALLQHLKAELLFPLDGGYVPVPVSQQESLTPFQYQLFSRKEGILIRFSLQPDTLSALLPHLESRRLALHLCSNNEDAFLTARDLNDWELEELFQADWGKVHLFSPKPEFGGGALYCQMLSIYREGRGMIHIFFLFNKPSELVENRLYLARFL